MVAAVMVATLVVTSLAGGSETVFYLTAVAGLAVGLWREGRRERSKALLGAARSKGSR